MRDWLFGPRYLFALDGTCNGLQHYSAMLRDPVGGAAVNLRPSDTPADIYQTVADWVTDALQREAREGGEDPKHQLMAGTFLQLGNRPEGHQAPRHGPALWRHLLVLP